MKKNFKTIVLFILIAMGWHSICLADPVKNYPSKKENSLTKEEVNLQLAMRKLWEDHITYTRNYIISAIANLGDVDEVAKRLMMNQDDIGNAVKTYYGDSVGNKLASLLKDHIQIAAEVVKAAKAGNTQEQRKADKKWHENAENIAIFLSSANPNWTKKNLTDFLYKHLELTTGEVVSRLKADWTNDINFYDKGHKHMLMFADALTKGIVQQFPEKFNK